MSRPNFTGIIKKQIWLLPEDQRIWNENKKYFREKGEQISDTLLFRKSNLLLREAIEKWERK